MLEDDPTSPANEGKLVAGKYRIERVIGVGGMGMLVAAHHEGLNTKVAIKFLLPEMLANKEIVARFTREAQAAVRITSEHIARVLDVGTADTGAPFIVMEYLEGGDLAGWLEQRGALPYEQAVLFVLHACVALAEAHGLGIVHRDLKPANLFCVRRPDGQLSIKVLDFGISKTNGPGGDGEMSATKTSTVMGSPYYMSPEQMRSTKDADAQSDIWSLGVILYQLITNKVPFDGTSATELAIKVATETPETPRVIRPDLPVGLEAIILRCLEKDRKKRFANVAELANALSEFGPASGRASVERIRNTIQSAGLSISAIDVPPSPQAIPLTNPKQATRSPAITAEPVTESVPSPRLGSGASRTSRTAKVGAFIAVAALVGAVVVVRGRPGESAPATAAASPIPATSASASASPTPSATSAASAAAATPVPSAPSAPSAPSTPSAPAPSAPAEVGTHHSHGTHHGDHGHPAAPAPAGAPATQAVPQAAPPPPVAPAPPPPAPAKQPVNPLQMAPM